MRVGALKCKTPFVNLNSEQWRRLHLIDRVLLCVGLTIVLFPSGL